MRFDVLVVIFFLCVGIIYLGTVFEAATLYVIGGIGCAVTVILMVIVTQRQEGLSAQIHAVTAKSTIEIESVALQSV